METVIRTSYSISIDGHFLANFNSIGEVKAFLNRHWSTSGAVILRIVKNVWKLNSTTHYVTQYTYYIDEF